MAETHVLMENIAMGESPRWHDGRLWFSDWVAQEIIAVDVDGKAQVIARPASWPFSIDWLPDGTLLVTSAHEPLVLRLDDSGELVTHADLSSVADYGFNEIVVDGRGNTYVNSPGFDLMAGEETKPGFVVLVTAAGLGHRVAEGVVFPNGMAVTADGATLIVAESYTNKLTAFDIDGDGTLSDGRVWAELGDDAPDGICIDEEEAVWYADVPHKHCVRVREGGDILETVNVDRGCFACMLGGEDGTTLFIVAQEWNGPQSVGTGPRTGQILTVRAPAPHAGRP